MPQLRLISSFPLCNIGTLSTRSRHRTPHGPRHADHEEMPQRPAPLPDHLGDAFTRASARKAGVSERRLRAKDLESPFHGVRQRPPIDGRFVSRTSLLTIDQVQQSKVQRRSEAYATVMPGRAFFTGRTAAVLCGLPVEHGEELEVGMPAPASAPQGRGIRGIKVRPSLVHVCEQEGLRLSTPASTWALLGRELSVRELVVVGDAIVRIPRDDRGRRQPALQLASIDQLRLAMTAGRRRGGAKLRAALEHVRIGSASPLETEYRLDAAASGLPEPELDAEIRNGAGALLGITEITYRSFRTLVEIEGDHHRTDRRQWDRDIEKYAAYVAEGWEVVRLTSRHIRGTEPRAVAMVAAALTRRGWRE